ncbi:uncharacterized protein GGS25DRAFT_531942 [Hypoxylon fragiforme]|uniref:uncharacterized protein n=1 Tax=Hypoxylon fragiforme TaxID=63214 RepID=UPI0020C640F8|nr:uncharacterized protein GGS25DRAFT_531942 [Hypoxylon fragiforme]KAI2609037.1 hypothetical protein GGS25DRAFT_531942 [Hypoxylon fragiforme]
MQILSILALAAPILGAVIKDTSIDSSINGTVIRDDIKVLCGAPPTTPDNNFPAYQYAYPIGLLLSGGSRKFHLDAGPGNCKQAACNAGGGPGVFICNDATHSIDILYTDAGYFAQQVYRQCKTRHADGVDWVEKGQAFCPDNWNVILTDVGPNCEASTLPPDSSA